MFLPNSHLHLCRSFAAHSQTHTSILSLAGDILFAMFNCSAESECTPILRMPLASRPLNLPSILSSVDSDGLEIHDRKTSSRQRQFEGQTHSPQLGPQGNPMPLEFPTVITYPTLYKELIQNLTPLGLENLDKRLSLDILIGKIKRDYACYTSSPDLLFLQQHMPDWECMSGKAGLQGVIPSLPWLYNSPDFSPCVAWARTEMLTRTEYEIYQFHVHAHLKEFARRRQVRLGILLYFLNCNVIRIICECYLCSQPGERISMSYVDFFYHTISDAPSGLESPLRFIKIKDTQFQMEPMVYMRTAEEVLRVLRFPTDEAELSLFLVGKTFECRCGGASLSGSPIALTFKDLVSLSARCCLLQINNCILLRSFTSVFVRRLPMSYPNGTQKQRGFTNL